MQNDQPESQHPVLEGFTKDMVTKGWMSKMNEGPFCGLITLARCWPNVLVPAQSEMRARYWRNR